MTDPAPALPDLASLDPFSVAVHLVEQGRVVESGPYWRRALAERPDDPERWYAWGSTLGQVGRYDDAEKALWGAIALGYDRSTVYEALGVVYTRKREHVPAEQAYQECVKRDPLNVSAWIALGNAGFARGDPVKGRAAYDHAAAVATHTPDGRASVAQARLWMGQYRLGWSAYEQRRNMSEWRAANREMPRLPGGPLGIRNGVLVHQGKAGYEPVRSGVPIVVSAEQGQGDAVQFARFLRPLAERFGVPIWFRAHTALVDLMRGALPDVRVLEAGNVLTESEVQGWVPLMSLPYFLGLASPKQVPPPIHPFGEQWASSDSGSVYVHESGNPGHAYDWDRSAPRNVLVEAVQRAGQTVVQYEPGETWRQTVDKMLACDRCVTVDTGLAHVAGSLGIPVDLFPPSIPEWRWGHKREARSPWYPSMRLWWRERSDGWAEVTERWQSARIVPCETSGAT